MALKKNLWTKMRIDVSEEEAQAYLDGFFTKYPGVRSYMDGTIRFVARHKFAWTFTGRRRRFPIASYSRGMAGRVGRQAVNARIQTTSSDIVSMNIVAVNDVVKNLGGRVLLTVHDSIVFQLPKGITGVKALLDKAITEKVAKDCPWLPVAWKYDCGYGPSYGEAKNEI